MYYTIQQAGLQDAIGVQMQDEATSESFSQSTMMETLVTPNSVTQDEVTSTENIQQRETQNTPVQEIPPISTQKTSKIQEIKPQVQENM